MELKNCRGAQTRASVAGSFRFGEKSELIGRLESGSSSSVVLEAEIVGTPESSPLGFSFDRLKSVGHWKNMDSPITTFFVAGIMMIGATAGGILYSDEIIEWIQGDQDYVLIEFDANQTRAYAEGLVSLGHPEWGGRLSGTVEEENTAQSIKTNFSNSGMPSTLE